MIAYKLHEIAEGCIEVKLDGDLVIGSEATSVRECLNPLAARFPELRVDLSDVRRIDSTGIGVLILAHSIATSKSGRMRVCNVARSVRDVLLLVKLLTVLGVDADAQRAA